jgi:DNA polymerase III alpha subunit (gram-positive type)
MKTIILDFETTGLNIFHDDIIEYALLDLHTGDSINSFVQLKNKREVSKFITKLTSITTNMTKNGELVDVAANNVHNFICKHSRKNEKVVLVAHNGDAFDFPLMKRLMSENAIEMDRKVEYFDTMRFAQILMPRLFSFRQANLCKVFKITNDAEHRAIGDVACLSKIYERLATMYSTRPSTIQDHLDFVYQKIR